MTVQEFFYWTASIALILIVLFTVGLLALLWYIKRLADKTSRKIIDRMDMMNEHVASAGRAWRNLTLTRFIIKTLRYIF